MAEPTLSSSRAFAMMDMLPNYYWEDPVTKDFLQLSGEETDKIGQLVREIFDNCFATQITELLIEYWEDAFNIPHNSSDSIETRRARVLSYTYRHHRIRKVDIATVVREFLSGAKAYVLQSYTDSNKIRVSTTSGFTVGNTVYVGSETTTITEIDISTSELILSDEVSPYPYALVSEQRVEIFEQYADYTFAVVVDETAITNQQPLIDAVEAAKPAHLGWRLYGQTNGLGKYDDILSLLDDVETTSDVELLYENVG